MPQILGSPPEHTVKIRDLRPLVSATGLTKQGRNQAFQHSGPPMRGSLRAARPSASQTDSEAHSGAADEDWDLDVSRLSDWIAEEGVEGLVKLMRQKRAAQKRHAAAAAEARQRAATAARQQAVTRPPLRKETGNVSTIDVANLDASNVSDFIAKVGLEKTIELVRRGVAVIKNKEVGGAAQPRMRAAVPERQPRTGASSTAEGVSKQPTSRGVLLTDEDEGTGGQGGFSVPPKQRPLSGPPRLDSSHRPWGHVTPSLSGGSLTGEAIARERDGPSFTDWRYSDKDMTPDKYDGRASLEHFMSKFWSCSGYHGWDEEERLAHLQCALEGGPAQKLVTEMCMEMSLLRAQVRGLTVEMEFRRRLIPVPQGSPPATARLSPAATGPATHQSSRDSEAGKDGARAAIMKDVQGQLAALAAEIQTFKKSRAASTENDMLQGPSKKRAAKGGCFNCGQNGHQQYDCPHREKSLPQRVKATREVTVTRSGDALRGGGQRRVAPREPVGPTRVPQQSTPLGASHQREPEVLRPRASGTSMWAAGVSPGVRCQLWLANAGGANKGPPKGRKSPIPPKSEAMPRGSNLLLSTGCSC